MRVVRDTVPAAGPSPECTLALAEVPAEGMDVTADYGAALLRVSEQPDAVAISLHLRAVETVDAAPVRPVHGGTGGYGPVAGGGVRVKYRTLVVDPPWPVRDSGPRTAAQFGNWERGAGTTGRPSVVPYARMAIADIAALPVGDMAERNAHLYLWAVNAYLEEAYDVARAWGFKPSSLLTWCKKPMGLGLGGTYVNTTEFVIFARRGSLAALRRVDTSWWEWRRPYIGNGGPTHSAKPEHFIDMVESVSPGPYVELFSRRHRLGWDTWGLESANTAQWEPAV